jgi:hypothetical protein
LQDNRHDDEFSRKDKPIPGVFVRQQELIVLAILELGVNQYKEVVLVQQLKHLDV